MAGPGHAGARVTRLPAHRRIGAINTRSRSKDLLTLLLAACSAAVAVIGLTLGSDGSASATAHLANTVPKLRISLSQPAPARQLLDPQSLWINPDSPAARARTTALAQGRTSDAALLAAIAGRPTASWLTNATSPATVQRVIASAAGQVPVFVTYYLPNRDCGSYSAGGATSATQYLSWVNSIVANLGNARAIVIVEPDAVAMAASHSCAAAVADSRLVLLSQAVAALKRAPNARVYLDAGNSGWVSNLTLLASTLNAAGLRGADGFSVNVSNFRTTSDSVAYGTRLSALAGNRHFVVDTSRNGAGPLPANSGYPGPSWCNPPGRALGTAPTLRTGLPLVDGYLWIKYPGESDGSCGLGDPSAGTFWLDYALGLARQAASR